MEGPVEQTKQNRWKSAALAAAGLVAGALLMWGWQNSPFSVQKQPLSENEGTGTETGGQLTGTAEITDSRLVINDQSGGFDIAIAHVVVQKPSWVVIYEDAGGQPGNALGAGRFIEGRNSGTVHLLRGTLPQNTYYGVIHLDDGDRIFSLERDFPVRDELGNPIMVRFVTQ